MKKENKLEKDMSVPVPEQPVLESNSGNSQSQKSKKIMIVLSVVAFLFALFFYFQSTRLENDPNKVSEKKISEVVEKVGKLIDLPQGEVPTLAEVSDAEALKDQPFFANAKNGDQVLLYTVAEKAFLYDPKADMIVEVASLNLGSR